MKTLSNRKNQNKYFLVGCFLMIFIPSMYALIVDLNHYVISGWISWPMLAAWILFVSNFVFPKYTE